MIKAKAYGVILLLLTMFTSCSNDRDKLRQGDLLFVVASTTDFSEAIADATAWGDAERYSHVAMLVEKDGELCVLEASSQAGVVYTDLDEFLGISDTIQETTNVVVKRVAVNCSIGQIVDRAKTYLGEPYDWSYLPDNGKMYCSELIYESYRSDNGTPLFVAHPMNFMDEQGNIPEFWVNLFDDLGEPIPQGVMGTNPNDMAKDSILTEVCRFCN